MVVSRTKVLTAFMLEYIDRSDSRGIETDLDEGFNKAQMFNVQIEDSPDVPQAELKKYLDCSGESIRRIMSEFEDQGIVEKTGRAKHTSSITYTLTDEPAADVMALFD